MAFGTIAMMNRPYRSAVEQAQGTTTLEDARDIAKEAAQQASEAQQEAFTGGIDVVSGQLDETMQLLGDYLGAGTTALQAQMDLMGLGDPGAQELAIQQIQEGPEFQALTQAGEDAILSNASATGGLRGGNVQRALAEYRPQVLSNLINQQYGRLSGLTGLGQQTATTAGSFGQSTASNIANLMGYRGAAEAGGYLGSAQAEQDYIQNKMQQDYINQLRKQSQQSQTGGLLGTLGGVAGTLLGGPVGGMAGKAIGEYIGGGF